MSSLVQQDRKELDKVHTYIYFNTWSGGELFVIPKNGPRANF